MGLGLLALAVSFLQGMALFVSYISNNAFPQPLSEEDEAKFLRAMGTGDREARNILIEHNLRLVAHITNMLCPDVTLIARDGSISLAFAYSGHLSTLR